MRVLLAGATGAIGRPLLAGLLAADHEVTALVRDEEKAAAVRAAGAEGRLADVFDADSVRRAALAAQPEVVIDQLTALPRQMDIRKYRAALQATNRLRREATPHLIDAARRAGARRIIVQSSSFITAPDGPRVHDEDAPAYEDAPAAFRETVAAALTLERVTLDAEDLEAVVLRYGFFYGPGTYYAPDGANALEIKARRFPLVGHGDGVTSFIHVDNAAGATIAALTGGRPGLYNVTDDEPAAAREWLPVAAEILKAKPPRRLPAVMVRLLAGTHVVHFATTLRGNSNERFKSTFDWEPSRPSWRTGLPASILQ